MQTSFAVDDASLETYLEQIGRIFDVPRMINERLEKPQVLQYFVANRISQLLWSSDGFFHYGLSCDGEYKKDDLTGQGRLIERYVHDLDAKRVLELACGLGANSAFLARRNPHITFHAIDIVAKPLRRYAILPNLSFQFGDYDDLKQFRDESFDLIFVIEGLCHSTNKLHVLRQAKKKLKRDGLFVVIDGYKRNRAKPLNHSEDLMWQLIEKSLSCDKIEQVLDVEGFMKREYSIIERMDHSQCVLASIARFEPLVRFYFAYPIFARILNSVVPLAVTKNIIHLLFFPISVRRQIGCYCVHVL